MPQSLNRPEGNEPKFKFYPIKDIPKFPDPQWLIKGTILDGGLTVIYRPTGAAKTFFLRSQWVSP